jgi:ribonuclease HI
MGSGHQAALEDAQRAEVNPATLRSDSCPHNRQATEWTRIDAKLSPPTRARRSLRSVDAPHPRIDRGSGD